MSPEPEEYVVRSGDATAMIVATGATLRSYVAAGRELLDGFGAGEAATGARGVVLAPWPNRIRDGAYRWAGAHHQLIVNETDKQTALHGLAADAAWTAEEHAGSRVLLTHRIDDAPGYPFTLDLRVSCEVTADGLAVTTTATNAGDVALPYGGGYHPYLRPPTTSIDECTLFVDAASYLPPDERGIPREVVPVGGTPFDFRTDRSLAGVVVDACFTEVARDAQGRGEVRLTDAGGSGAAVWFDASYGYVQLYTGDTLPQVERRRRGLAVEPMTCPPNAFQSGVDVIALDPGESVSSTWGIRPLG